ncbi:unnamed protein product [Pleuronectes platessa]|uniref:Uncharacterized protein n=1 Tax=Pleuronectes platessa TaxID=8262 RepID=A0A9N7UCD4_PLEPL|nr:unnamed protein product [Pleuronectes platessa]
MRKVEGGNMQHDGRREGLEGGGGAGRREGKPNEERQLCDDTRSSSAQVSSAEDLENQDQRAPGSSAEDLENQDQRAPGSSAEDLENQDQRAPGSSAEDLENQDQRAPGSSAEDLENQDQRAPGSSAEDLENQDQRAPGSSAEDMENQDQRSPGGQHSVNMERCTIYDVLLRRGNLDLGHSGQQRRGNPVTHIDIWLDRQSMQLVGDIC